MRGRAVRSGRTRRLPLPLGVMLVVALGGSPARGISPAIASPSWQQPRSDGRPALAMGRQTALVWREVAEGGRRIRASIPATSRPVKLGPRWSRQDGLPSTAAAGESVWVVASRSDGNGRLWAQRWTRGQWQRPRPGPTATTNDHHPAIAAGPDGPWLVWVGGDDAAGKGRESLFAARWTNGRWSPAERLPAAPNSPMAPAIAVDARGRVMVAWAADDGQDAEIWVSWRTARRWTEPVALSDNRTPDITPTVSASGSSWLVAWSSFRNRGYFPVASTGNLERGFGAGVQLSGEPGSSPQALASSLGFEVIWAAPRYQAGLGTVLRAKRIEGRKRAATIELATAADTRFGATRDPEGHLLVSWIGSDNQLVLARHHANEASPDRRPGFGLETIIGRQTAPVLPKNPALQSPSIGATLSAPAFAEPTMYLVFGDSITEGITTIDGLPIVIDGYDTFLKVDLAMLQYEPVTIHNAGVGGEGTVEGLSRLAGLLAGSSRTAFDAVLLMQGTIDVSSLLDPAIIAFNLRNMVELAVGAGKLVFLGLIMPRRQPGALFGGPLNRRVDEVNQRLPKIAREAGAILVDTHTGFKDRLHLYSDIVHPTSLGYDVLAELWYAGIKPVLLALRSQLDTFNGLSDDGAAEP